VDLTGTLPPVVTPYSYPCIPPSLNNFQVLVLLVAELRLPIQINSARETGCSYKGSCSKGGSNRGVDCIRIHSTLGFYTSNVFIKAY